MERMDQRSSFERLALPHLDAAFNLAFWLVRSEADAEDIVQDAYVRAFRGFHGFAGTDARPWLLAIVRNAAYRWLSNRRRSANVISLDEAFAADAVLIASPTPTHADYIERAAAAGRAIFCEKPIDLAVDRVRACRQRWTMLVCR